MKICRFERAHGQPGVGLIVDGGVLDLGAGGIQHLADLLESDGMTARLTKLRDQELRCRPLHEVRLLPPIERQEVWAAGVTYLRSKQARMEESDFSADAYDRVYEACRPELFLKAMPDKVVGPADAIGIRRDATWNVPEPELVLVINSRGQIVGYTIGNDMSSRDIEGENLLYLPQAKIYDRSCSVGPYIAVGMSEAEARTWTIELCIERGGSAVFQGSIGAGQIKRSFEELVRYLYRSQTFPHGVFLFTGTGVVPPEDFSLLAGDIVRIGISGIGVIENTVVTV
jgi:2-dehydro-3-deoxy-D-arabinonate dehydratase